MNLKKTVYALLLVLIIGWVVLPPVLAANQERININTATEKELTQLKNIGEKYAARIVAFRKKNGPFKTIDDLTKVKGIGSKIIELNRDRLSVK